MSSENLDCKLINLVKNNPVLYNPNDVKYMDFNAREVAWHKIGDEMRRSAADCKVRWIHIRDVHRRILRKSIRQPSLKIKKYKYDNHLAFMKPFYKELTTQKQNNLYDEFNDDDEEGNCNETYNEETEPFNEENDAADSDESDKPIKKVKKGRPKTKKAKAAPKSKKIAHKTEEQEEEPEKSTLDEVKPSMLDPKDPVDAFLLSIGAILKSFTPYHLNLVKSKIFTVVQQHELQQIVDQPQTRQTLSASNHDHMY